MRYYAGKNAARQTITTIENPGARADAVIPDLNSTGRTEVRPDFIPPYAAVIYLNTFRAA